MFKPNQKVRVIGDVRNDGTCSSCKSGTIVAKAGEEGFVKEVGEFLFREAIIVHFIEKGKVIGFRPHELAIIEDYDADEGVWIKLDEPLYYKGDIEVLSGCSSCSCSTGTCN